jgi:hypothetical protein
MRKAFLFFAMIVAVGLAGCSKTQSDDSLSQDVLQASCVKVCTDGGNWRLNNVAQVILRSGGGEIVYRGPAPEQHVFSRNIPGLTSRAVTVIDDLAVGQAAWVESETALAVTTSPISPKEWRMRPPTCNCGVALTVHVAPDMTSKIVTYSLR